MEGAEGSGRKGVSWLNVMLTDHRGLLCPSKRPPAPNTPFLSLSPSPNQISQFPDFPLVDFPLLPFSPKVNSNSEDIAGDHRGEGFIRCIVMAGITTMIHPPYLQPCSVRTSNRIVPSPDSRTDQDLKGGKGWVRVSVLGWVTGLVSDRAKVR